MGDIGLLNVRGYVATLGYAKKEINEGVLNCANDYAMAVFDEDEDIYTRVAGFGGDVDLIDTSTEAAVATYYSLNVRNIRPPEAVAMLGSDSKTASLQLGAAAYMDMQAARFLGSDPAPHAAALKFITDRGNVSEADIKKFMAQGIAAAVDAEFGKVSFLLRNSKTNPVIDHNAVLTYSPNQGYTLIYEGAYTTNGHQEITASTLDALLAEMGRRKTDFDQTGIDQVRAEAALIPAVSQSGKTGKVEPRTLVAHGLTAFYTARTRQEMTEALKIIEGICVIRLYPLKYSGQQEKDKAIETEHAIYAALGALNLELSDIVLRETNSLILALQSNKLALENVLNRVERDLISYQQ
ncbi:hypothetical protein NO2_1084 [Candidatus Termititenax persephonae]|uniref:Uncharacterized protein n=1 Tax=Candidatus Termititenax persephonae TaxID=2218525 RepID=A0A388THF0_9BACT|nr:hypothetical protein NO2_1084 [Candidatus Termititenax persephonae]